MPPKSTITTQGRAQIEADNLRKLNIAKDNYELDQIITPSTSEAPTPTAVRTPLIAKKDQGVSLPTGSKGIEDPPLIQAAEGEVTTASDLVETSEREGSGLNRFVEAAAKQGVFDDETQTVLRGDNPEQKAKIQEGIERDLASQSARASRDTPATYRSTNQEEFMSNLGLKPELTSGVSSVMGQGIIFNDKINNAIRPSLANSTEEAFKLQDFITSNGLWDSNTQRLTPNVGTALAVSFLSIANDINNKTDNSVNSEQIELTGDSLNPDSIRERISSDLFDRLLENPNVGSDPRMRTGFGKASAAIDPEVKSMFDLIAYKIFSDQGLFDVQDLNQYDDTTTIKEEIVRLSGKGVAYFENAKDVLYAIHPDRRVNVSYSPAPVEGLPGRERELGDKAKSISKRNKSSKNTILEDTIKLKLSTIPLRIDKEGLQYASMLVNDTVYLNERGMVAFQESSPTGRTWSVGKFASLLGLDEANWMEAREKALKRYGKERESEANDEADKAIRMKARKALQTIEDGFNNVDTVFYNKYMHASSVGRFFVRNTVLNGQSDKALSRGMVISAKKLVIKPNNPLKGRDKRLFDNWKYIIGKNLLDPDTTSGYDLTNKLRTEDMTWNAISKLSNEIIDNPNNETYNIWYSKGVALRKALEEGNIDNLKKAIDNGPHAKSFLKSGEWGYKLQSYIDFANYVDAKKNNTSFEMRATTQHDGKQNGIAIQAMQTGNFSMLKLVGMIYSADSDNVIPQGDIRDLFFQSITNSVDRSFSNTPDKANFWSDLLNEIKNQPTENRISLIKDLSKVPLMESSYGMPVEFHFETALKFLDSKEGKNIFKSVEIKHAELKDYFQDRIKVASDLNTLIGAGLTTTLNLDQQKLYKNAGMVWAMLGVTPEMLGPLGTDIYMGTNEHFKTGKTIEVENEDGSINILEMTEKRSTGSSGKRVRGRVFNKETQEYTMAERSRFGKLVSNQLPVLTVQQIDATIMARTLDNVNKNFNKRGQAFEPVKFVLPVHDAIITNADGVDVYHREINNQFKKVNMEYSISQSIYQGLSKAMDKMKERVSQNPNKLVDINYESRYRAVHDQIVLIEDRINEQKRIYFEATGKEISDDQVGGIPSSDKALLKMARQEGWTRDGGQLRLATLYQIIVDYEKKRRIKAKLKARHEEQESLKSKVFNALAERPYQYN